MLHLSSFQKKEGGLAMSNKMGQTSRRILIILASIVAFFYIFSRSGRKEKALKSLQLAEQNRSNSRRFFEEIWNRGNVAVIDELLTLDFARNDLFTPVLGREEFKQFVSLYRTAFP